MLCHGLIFYKTVIQTMMHGPGPGRGRRHGGSNNGPNNDSTPPLKITDKRMLKWFADYLKPHWLKILVGTLAMIGSTLISLAPALILGKGIINKVIIEHDQALLMKYIIFMGGAFLLDAILSAARMNIMHRLGQRFVFDLRTSLYKHIQTLSLSFFEKNETGNVMSKVSNDVNAVEDMVVHGTDTLISDSLYILFVIGGLFYLRPEMALWALCPVPIILVSLIIFSRYIRPIFRKIRDELGEINAKLQERISGIPVIKAFAREDYESAIFNKAANDYYKSNVKTIWLWSSFFPAVTLIASFGILLVTWRGAMISGELADVSVAGDMVVFVGWLQGFYGRFGGLVRVYNIYNSALSSVSRIFELLDEKPDVEDAPNAKELGVVEGRVALDNVSFRYATGEMVLEKVSVIADPGETIALVGRSGAGKTSLVNLVPRFYDPVDGTVTVDGVDVRTVTQKSLRDNMAMVLQETFLFNGTVNENVRYGKLDASDEEILLACKAAYADEFIQALPEKYDTEIGERGVKLSGGQKQRLAIARALLADPRILILDEATSLVDTEAEQIIQKALENLMRGRTTFVIAHRLSTIRNADKIVVIDHGEVIEQADHSTLMERNGLYAQMYERQFRFQETGIPIEGGLLG